MIELNAKLRTIIGSQVKSLRKKGFFPAIIYGQGIANSQPIVTSFIDFERVYKAAGESTIVALDVAGKKYNVLIHDVARDPIKDKLIHADFYVVDMDKIIRTTVPLAFIGESSAIKNDGGILVKVMHEIEVEALPKDLPHELPVDLGLLSMFGSKILAKDILLPSGVKIIADINDIIVLIEAPRTDEVLAELEQGSVGSVVEVKTEQEEKRAAKEVAAEEKE